MQQFGFFGLARLTLLEAVVEVLTLDPLLCLLISALMAVSLSRSFSFCSALISSGKRLGGGAALAPMFARLLPLLPAPPPPIGLFPEDDEDEPEGPLLPPLPLPFTADEMPSCRLMYVDGPPVAEGGEMASLLSEGRPARSGVRSPAPDPEAEAPPAALLDPLPLPLRPSTPDSIVL